MTDRILYPSLVQPPPQTAERNVALWFRPLSEPQMNRRKGYTISLTSTSGFISPVIQDGIQLAATDGADSAAMSILLDVVAALAATDGADSLAASILLDTMVQLAAVDGADTCVMDIGVSSSNVRMTPIRDWWDFDAGGNLVPGFCIRNT